MQRKSSTLANQPWGNYSGQCFIDNDAGYAEQLFSINLGTNTKHTECIENTQHKLTGHITDV